MSPGSETPRLGGSARPARGSPGSAARLSSRSRAPLELRTPRLYCSPASQPASGSRGRGARSTAPPARPARGRGGAAAPRTTGGVAPPSPQLSAPETADPRRRRPRLSSRPARALSRPPGPSAASRRCRRTVGGAAARLPGRCPSCGGDLWSGTTVPRPRPGALCAAGGPRTLRDARPGSPAWASEASNSPGVPLAREPGAAVPVPPRGRGGRGRLGPGPRSPPSPPPRRGEFRPPGSSSSIPPAQPRAPAAGMEAGAGTGTGTDIIVCGEPDRRARARSS